MTIILRPYQNKGVAAFAHQLFDKNEESTFAFVATGLGKTLILADFLKQHAPPESARALVLASTNILVWQLYKDIIDYSPELEDARIGPMLTPAIGLEMNTLTSPHARYVVATRQTLTYGDDFKRLDHTVKAGGAFDIVLIDEGDEAGANSYRELLAKLREINPKLKVVGVSATTIRLDKYPLRNIYKTLAFQMPATVGIAEGWLKKVEGRRVQGVTEFNDVESLLADNAWMDLHFSDWKNDGQLHSLAFLPSVQLGRELCLFFQQKGVPSVHIDSDICIDLSGRTHKQAGVSYDIHRMNVLLQLQNEAVYVTNKSVLTRGFNWRKVERIYNFAGAGAEDVSSNLTQKLGRLFRHAPGVSRVLEPEEGLYRVEFYDGTVEESRNPSVHVKGVYVDYTNSQATVQMFADLTGYEESVKEERVVQDEDGELIIEEVDEDYEEDAVVIVNLKEKTRALFSATHTNWMVDNFSDMSTSYGKDSETGEFIPWLLYVRAPQLSQQSFLGKRIRELEERSSPDKHEIDITLAQLKTMYNIISYWTVWTCKRQKNWFNAYQVTLSHNMFRDMPSAFMTHKGVQSHMGAYGLAMQEYLDGKGFAVNTNQTRKWRNSKNQPTEGQFKQLTRLRTDYLPKSGWENPYWDTPQTLNQASLLINHMYAKGSMLQYLKSILAKENPTVLPELGGLVYG